MAKTKEEKLDKAVVESYASFGKAFSAVIIALFDVFCTKAYKALGFNDMEDYVNARCPDVGHRELSMQISTWRSLLKQYGYKPDLIKKIITTALKMKGGETRCLNEFARYKILGKENLIFGALITYGTFVSFKNWLKYESGFEMMDPERSERSKAVAQNKVIRNILITLDAENWKKFKYHVESAAKSVGDTTDVEDMGGEFRGQMVINSMERPLAPAYRVTAKTQVRIH